MKTLFVSLVSLFVAAVAAPAADVTATLTEVHLCCKGCVTGVEKAVADIPGVKVSADQGAGTVTLTGPDAATVQKAADALVQAGYFGKSSDGAVAMTCNTGAKGQQVQSLKVEGVHLCCAKCVKAVDRAVKSVPGAKAQTAVKGATSFEVTGDFNDQALFAALQKEGLAGRVGK